MTRSLISLRVNKAVLFLLYPALGLLAGWASIAAGWGGKSRAEPEVSHGRREARRSTPPWEAEDFFKAARKKTGEGMHGGATAITDLTATWTDAEIRTALEAAMQDPDAMVRHDSPAALLFREYSRRDVDTALEWMEGGSPFRRKWCASLAAMEWPPDRWREGLDFMRRHREWFDSPIPAKSFATRCLPHVSARGPEEVVAMMERLVEDGHDTSWSWNARYTQGFDFKALLESPAFRGLKPYRNTVITAWTSRDRDAAFQWVLERDGPKGLNLLAPYPPAARSTVRWFVGKVEGLTPEQRTAFMKGYASQLRNLGAEAKVWMEMAATPALREEIITAAAQGVYFRQRSSVEEAMRAVGSLPEAEARLRLLETLPPSPALGINLPMEDEAQTLLRQTLHAWGADPARTDLIISRYADPRTQVR